MTVLFSHVEKLYGPKQILFSGLKQMLKINVCFRHLCCNALCHLQTLWLNRSCLYYMTLIEVTGDWNKAAHLTQRETWTGWPVINSLWNLAQKDRLGCWGSILWNLEFGSFEPELEVGVDSNQIPDVELRTWQFQVYMNNTIEQRAGEEDASRVTEKQLAAG